ALILFLWVLILLHLDLLLLMLGGLATSSSRATNLNLLLPPILSVSSYHLAYPLWYGDSQLVFLSGCAHRCCERDDGCRGQSDHHLAYHGAHSSLSGRAPQPLKIKLNSSDTVAPVRQYRAVRKFARTATRPAGSDQGVTAREIG